MSKRERKWLSVGFNDSGFQKKFVSQLNIGDRFYISPKSSEIISNEFNKKFDDVKVFIIGSKLCYQINATTDPRILKSKLSQVNEMWLSRGRGLKHFDHRRQVQIKEFSEQNKTTEISVESHWYHIKKLKWPYRDVCIFYEDIGYNNRLDAICRCTKLKNSDWVNWIPEYQIVRKKDVHYYGNITQLTSSELLLKCTEMYPNLDCNQRIYITAAAISFDDLLKDDPDIKFYVIDNKNPSFVIKSKPRIDDIDFVTYIFGALGAWIGFSFISINPIPYLIMYEKNRISKDESWKIQILYREAVMSRNRIKKLESRIVADRVKDIKDRRLREEENDANHRQTRRLINQLFTELRKRR